MTVHDDQTLDELIEEILAFDERSAEQAEFDTDLAYLNALGDAMIHHTAELLHSPCGPTVEEQLLASVSTGVREAISPHGWTFAEMWAALS
jgi:hypothetical protein